MSALLIKSSGFQPTLQDLGRPHVQSLGIPPSGALDTTALRLANRLVGNQEGEAAIELRLLGPTVEVMADSVRIALAGSGSSIEILDEKPVKIPPQQSVRLTRGQSFRIASLADTAVAYLAVEGGFSLPPVYGSLSTYVRAAIGGMDGRAIKDGDELPLVLNSVPERGEVKLSDESWRQETGPLRILLGPQQDFFTQASIERFFASSYSITTDADRMGVRLEGEKLSHVSGHDIVSDGIVTGAIQVPGSGLPIILLADHQTTGGYPKLGTVISADLPRVGRMRPGDQVRFQQVQIEEAEQARAELEAKVSKLTGSLEPAGAWLDEVALYSRNLISGVVGEI